MMSLLYSMAGDLLCLGGMLVLKRLLPERYIWFCSILGAVLHNVWQIIVACLIAVWGMIVYLPFLLISGFLAGAFTEGCVQLIVHKLSFKNRRQ